ncbi:MAG TPA: FoF1 ATP synthase subunit gamma [Candidatus Bathyarchaeia archaeon]|nr:FoF1 ATP synthase subunit gamma [Candidatus Bathyarchaeia archaeon]
MSQLIQLKQRLFTIETIKKLTHALRLIAMSSHAQVKTEESHFAAYCTVITELFVRIKRAMPSWHHPIIAPETAQTTPKLIIIIGAQKGLCGSFNTTLFRYCLEKIDHTSVDYHYAAIGKKAVAFVTQQLKKPLVFSRAHLSTHTCGIVAQELCDFVLYNQKSYHDVSIVSNHAKTFFVQQPQQYQLLPVHIPPQISHTVPEEYLWEQDPHTIITILAREYLIANMSACLLTSLLAEHAARFISMDSATRNADNILEESRILYNKLRQAKITKELTELVGSFLTEER